MENKFDKDFKRQSSAVGIKRTLCIIRHRNLLALWCARKSELKTGMLGKILSKISELLFEKSHLEVAPTRGIGGGFLMVHPYNITINSRSQIGENFTIFKGATIGSIRSGKKEGTPRIGNRVTVCANAMVCGNITIGDDVLIAANAYVNFDVPSNSVVVGNPGAIHYKNKPSTDYLG